MEPPNRCTVICYRGDLLQRIAVSSLNNGRRSAIDKHAPNGENNVQSVCLSGVHLGGLIGVRFRVVMIHCGILGLLSISHEGNCRFQRGYWVSWFGVCIHMLFWYMLILLEIYCRSLVVWIL